jgi:hypothetical protein
MVDQGEREKGRKGRKGKGETYLEGIALTKREPPAGQYRGRHTGEKIKRMIFLFIRKFLLLFRPFSEFLV